MTFPDRQAENPLSGPRPVDPALGGVGSPYATPGSEPLPETTWDTHVPTGSQVRPWVRYWARSTDVICFSILLGAVLGVMVPEWLEDIPETALGIVFLAGYRVLEAVMFAAFGTTPFKALLRVRVRRADGRRLSFLDALRRSLNVWLRGEGLGIPLVSLITHVTSYSRLQNHGITSWDRDGGFVVSHQKIEWWRWLALIVTLVGVVSVIVWGSMEG